MPATLPIKKNDSFRGSLLNIILSQANGIPAIPKEVQILRTGTYYDERYGRFEITPLMLLSMKQNFDNKVMNIDPAFDYKHESDDIAAGWIQSLELRGDGGTELWAKADWTPTAEKKLSDKEFRYVSADFTLNFINNETLKEYGPTLRGAALTNRPVIKGMVPVTLTEGEGNMDEKDKLIAQLQQKVAELEKKVQGEKEPDGDEGDKGEHMMSLKKHNEEMQKKLDEYAEKEKKMLADKAKEEEDKKMAEKKSKFEKLMSEGKAVKAQEEAFMKNDMEKFFELSEKLHTDSVGNSGVEVNATKNIDSQILELAEKKIKEDKSLNMPTAISKVLAENPKLAEQRRK